MIDWYLTKNVYETSEFHSQTPCFFVYKFSFLMFSLFFSKEQSIFTLTVLHLRAPFQQELFQVGQIARLGELHHHCVPLRQETDRHKKRGSKGGGG